MWSKKLGRKDIFGEIGGTLNIVLSIRQYEGITSKSVG